MKKINKSNNSLLTDGPTPCSHYHIASSHSISTLKLPVQKKKTNNENTIDIQNKSKADQTEKTLFDCVKLETKPYEKISLTIPLKNMKHLEDFDVGPKVGKGKFSEVFLARDKQTNFIVGLKVLKKSVLKQSGLLNQMKREIWIQSLCRHKNILQIYGFFFDSQKIYLILEFASDGDLYSLLKKQKNGRFTEQQAATYVKQLCEALISIHKMKIIHRDIKPENLMLSFGNLKIADFGLAIETEFNEEKRQTFCGTMDYISPEMFERMGHDYRVDIWSVGVLCYELCSGKAPFESENARETMKKACLAQYKYPDYFSSDLKELLQKLLVIDPDHRIGLEDILESPWIKQNVLLSSE